MSRLDHYPAELKYTIQELEYLIVSSGLIGHHDIEKKNLKKQSESSLKQPSEKIDRNARSLIEDRQSKGRDYNRKNSDSGSKKWKCR